jgi:hypothetical protein
MATIEERLKILNMIAEGKISAEEGAQLLNALKGSGNRGGSASPSPEGTESRYLRIRIHNEKTGREQVNVNVPLHLVNVAMRMGARFAPEMEGMDIEEVLEAIRQGARGKIIEVTDDEQGEHVEIFVE